MIKCSTIYKKEFIMDDIYKVNNQSVKDALNKMKAMKSEAVFDFSSDCLMNASKKLIDHVTTLFIWFLATGKIPVFLLLCTLVPIVKDNLDNIAIVTITGQLPLEA